MFVSGAGVTLFGGTRDVTTANGFAISGIGDAWNATPTVVENVHSITAGISSSISYITNLV